MGLSKYKLGDLLQQRDERNQNLKYSASDVKGISIKKIFIETKADLAGVSLRPYILVKPDYFAYVPVTSRNGEKITIAHNNTSNTYIVSSSYIVFSIAQPDALLPKYLYLYFNRPEFDRYSRFNSWGSARETFSWEDLCNTEIVLPDIQTQRNCVNVYLGMQENLDALRKSVEQMQYTCDVCINEALRTAEKHPIGEYIEETDFRNTDLQYAADDVMGMTITKQIIPTKANMNGTALDNFRIVYPEDFVYNPRTHGKKIGLGFNQTGKPIIISWNNASFRVKDSKKGQLLPEYLYLWFCRSEWDREACFRSWGSSTEVFTWDALCEMKISVPNVSVQQSIVNIYNAYNTREKMVERLENLQKDICPILVRGAIEEGGR